MTDLRQAAETLQLEVVKLKQMLEQQQAEPTCPDCKAAVLYECVACSSNNYPPKQQAEPPQRQWVGLEIEEVQDSYNSDYQAQTRAVEKLLKERNT